MHPEQDLGVRNVTPEIAPSLLKGSDVEVEGHCGSVSGDDGQFAGKIGSQQVASKKM